MNAAPNFTKQVCEPLTTGELEKLSATLGATRDALAAFEIAGDDRAGYLRADLKHRADQVDEMLRRRHD